MTKIICIFVMLFSYENIKDIPVVTLPISRSATLDSLCNNGVFFMKFCFKCQTSKDVSQFSKGSDRPDGLSPTCKECCSKRKAAYTLKNKEKILEKNRAYQRANRDKLQVYRDSVRERSRAYFKKRYAENGHEIKSKRNSPQGRIVRNKRQRERMLVLHNRIKRNCGVRIWHALKRNVKSKRTVQLIGCTIEDLTIYLEKKFTDGMSWENYGRNGWHIDHIKPCAKFDLSCPIQQQICFHFTNLQPLWEADNIRKKDKYPC